MYTPRLPLSELWLIFVLSVFRYPLLYNHGTVNLCPVYFILFYGFSLVSKRQSQTILPRHASYVLTFRTFVAFPGKLLFHLTFGNVSVLKHLKCSRKKHSVIKMFSAEQVN